MKQYMLGVALIALLSLILFTLNKIFAPTTYLSYLEWWGIISIILVIYSGIDTYQKEGWK